MGIRSVAAPKPEPKANCPSCHRPMSMLKLGKCLYCGAEMPGALRLVESKPAMAPELLIAFEPRPRETSSRSPWIKRFVIFGVSSMLLTAVMSQCMKLPK